MGYENWDTVVSLDITRAELYTIANCVNSVVIMGEISDFMVGYEELSMDPSSVRLERLNAGGPLLKVHDLRTLDSVIGFVAGQAAREWIH